MKLRNTKATADGRATIWNCRNCGTTICMPEGWTLTQACPACGKDNWHQERLPISIFTEYPHEHT